jgi:hypothetical protein
VAAIISNEKPAFSRKKRGMTVRNAQRFLGGDLNNHEEQKKI